MPTSLQFCWPAGRRFDGSLEDDGVEGPDYTGRLTFAAQVRLESHRATAHLGKPGQPTLPERAGLRATQTRIRTEPASIEAIEEVEE